VVYVYSLVSVRAHGSTQSNLDNNIFHFLHFLLSNHTYEFLSLWVLSPPSRIATFVILDSFYILIKYLYNMLQWVISTDLDAIASKCSAMHLGTNVIGCLLTHVDTVKLTKLLSVKPRQINIRRPTLNTSGKTTQPFNEYSNKLCFSKQKNAMLHTGVEPELTPVSSLSSQWYIQMTVINSVVSCHYFSSGYLSTVLPPFSHYQIILMTEKAQTC